MHAIQNTQTPKHPRTQNITIFRLEKEKEQKI